MPAARSGALKLCVYSCGDCCPRALPFALSRALQTLQDFFRLLQTRELLLRLAELPRMDAPPRAVVIHGKTEMQHFVEHDVFKASSGISGRSKMRLMMMALWDGSKWPSMLREGRRLHPS